MTQAVPARPTSGASANQEAFDLHLQRVTKRFDPNAAPAVDDLSLGVRPGEFVFLLGPSGCGKTTTLRIVAGFVRPDSGAVILRGRDVARVPAYKRQIGLVFQSYALFPHMSVAENIAYGLRMRGVKRDEIRRRVDRVLETVQLGPLGQRLPRQLSGGQQQRVALARAIVVEPQILLLDEPFSNLDQRLRQELRQEVRSLQRSLDITSVFVTHDQEEALTMADRIAVLHLGRLQQVGTPDDLYERPASSFVARFLGDCNLLRGTLDVVEASRARLRTPAGLVAVGVPAEGAAFTVGMAAEAIVRPERIRIAAAQDVAADNSVTGRVDTIVYRGGARRYLVRLDRDASTMVVDVPNTGAVPAEVGEGAAVNLNWAVADCRVLASDA